MSISSVLSLFVSSQQKSDEPVTCPVKCNLNRLIKELPSTQDVFSGLRNCKLGVFAIEVYPGIVLLVFR